MINPVRVDLGQAHEKGRKLLKRPRKPSKEETAQEERLIQDKLNLARAAQSIAT